MPLLKNSVFSIMLSITALGASARADGQQGRFTLPFDAQWGNVTLKAGDYVLSAPAMGVWPQIISLSGNEKTVYILAGNEVLASVSDKSYLQIVNINGVHVVREYRSGIRGKSFTFGLPKKVRAQMASGKPAGTDVVVMIRH